MLTRWFSRLSGHHRGAASALARRLQAYPAFAAPHTGPASRWTAAQAQENLQYLLDQREPRLAAIAALLADDGIDIRPALAGGDAAPLFAALHAWALAHWLALRPARFDHAAWLASTRTGGDIVYSMLMDLALLLGELIVRRRGTLRWGVDRNEDNARDRMASWQRAVLLAPRVGLAPEAIDVEAIVVARMRNIDSPSEALVDHWAQVFAESVSGAYERVY